LFKQCVENEILLTVAKSQGVTFDELQRKVRESANKTDFQVSILKIKRSEQSLIKDGFIEEKPPQTKNEPSTEAVLTLSGLFRVLEYVFAQKALTGDSLRETLDIIAENQAEKLPLVFKKWLYFNSHGMQEKMIARLRSYFHFFPAGYHYISQYRFLNKLTAAGAKEVTRNDLESMQLTTFYDYFFLINPENEHSITEKQWDRALATDSEIRKYVVERLQIRREEYLPKVNYVNRRIKFFEDSQLVA
jgi:hypothetical protein